MPNVLEQRWLGRRVTVRRVVGRTEQGRTQYGDVVGDLVRLDASVAVIETRHGPVEVDLNTIMIGKPAPPSTADELALQAVMASGWRAAETGHVGGWLLRATGGFTGRANSVLPLRAPGIPLEQALGQARAWYHAHGLPLRLMIPSEARRLLDADLGERGWPIQYGALVMAARTDQLHANVRTDVDVQLHPRPDDAWFARYRDGAGTSETARALLTRHDNVIFASINDGDRAVAIGRATVDDRWLGVTAVEVDPALRRAGLATAVMAALWRWGGGRGATHGYLQVHSENEAAIGMYERQGYWVHHDYRYRIDPDDAANAVGVLAESPRFPGDFVG
jgi:ribosomal protein S18 acetylase RimI-like enzyme